MRGKRPMWTGILYLVGAIFAFGLGHYLNREIREKHPWPTVPGNLLERGVGPRMHTQGPGTFLPHVKYSYVVNGTEYVGDQCYLIRGTGGLEDQIRKLVDGLPDPVPVHYNPTVPQESYLLVNPLSTFWILLGMGTLAAVIGVMQLITATMKP